MAPASGPDSRTMEIALGGLPDDRAKMVCSRGCIAYYLPIRLEMLRSDLARIGKQTNDVAVGAQHESLQFCRGTTTRWIGFISEQ